MSFVDNADRHSFPHTLTTGYENLVITPSDLDQGHLDGSIFVAMFESGVRQTRRKRKEIRLFTFRYGILDIDEWKELWDFYNNKAEHELHYFYINLYYMDHEYDNEWIGINFNQKIAMKNFSIVLGTTGLSLIENVQATMNHISP